MEAYARWRPVSPNPSDAAVGATPAALARDILQSFLEQQWDRLQALLHAEAELETGFSVPGARFDATNVLDRAWVATNTGAYRPEYEAVETLDEQTALVAARIRFQVGADDFSVRDAAYLMTFKDGLLWRTRIFDSVEDALAAHGEGRSEKPAV